MFCDGGVDDWSMRPVKLRNSSRKPSPGGPAGSAFTSMLKRESSGTTKWIAEPVQVLWLCGAGSVIAINQPGLRVRGRSSGRRLGDRWRDDRAAAPLLAGELVAEVAESASSKPVELISDPLRPRMRKHYAAPRRTLSSGLVLFAPPLQRRGWGGVLPIGDALSRHHPSIPSSREEGRKQSPPPRMSLPVGLQQHRHGSTPGVDLGRAQTGVAEQFLW